MIRTRFILGAILFMLALPALAIISPVSAQSNPMHVSGDQRIAAKLSADLNVTKAKVGDVVQAELTDDAKRGHDTILKKGSVLTGKIAKVQTYGSGTPSQIVIAFDTANPKGGQPAGLNARIDALAPPPSVQIDSLQDGRGMAATNINSAVSGGSKDMTSGGELRLDASGVHGIPGTSLGSETQNGKIYSLIQSSAGDIKLKKGTQIVFVAPEQ